MTEKSATTIVHRVLERLDELPRAGSYPQEIPQFDERVGFEAIALVGDTARRLAE